MKKKLLVYCSVLALATTATVFSSKSVVNAADAPAPGEVSSVESRNEMWAKQYPNQYNSWRKTSQSEQLEDLLKKKPQLAILWAGYGFAKDYNAPRGHFYAIQDNVNTLRTGAPVSPVTGPQPTACWSCKSPDVARLIKDKGEKEFFTEKWAKYGSEAVNSIGCADCHDSKTAAITLTRPYVERGLEAMGTKVDKLTKQDMRSLVCAQCHSEYYFKKTEEADEKGEKKITNTVTFPWNKGLKGENIEAYYDEINFTDWTHAISKAPMLKAQHPDYELFTLGIHARKGLSCADCHMPVTQKDGVKFSDHHVTSPLENISNTCLNCHQGSEADFKEFVKVKLERKEELMAIAMNSLAKAHLEAGKAWEVGATEEEMKDILKLLRHG